MDFRFGGMDNEAAAAGPSSSRCSSSSEVVERRVKEEIRIREMAWRRKVEVEIRREIIMEQELAILRAAERTLDDEQFSMKSSGQRMLNQSNSSPLRFLEPPKEATNDEEKDKPILLPRPNPQRFEAKRKAMRPPTEAEAEAVGTEPKPPFGWILKKAKKDEEDNFFCKTCKITTSSQTSFDAHLRGKKHQAKSEASKKVVEKITVTPVEEEEEEEELEEIKPGPEIENKGFFKFWCEIYQIGTQSMIVMENQAQNSPSQTCMGTPQHEPNPIA